MCHGTVQTVACQCLAVMTLLRKMPKSVIKCHRSVIAQQLPLSATDVSSFDLPYKTMFIAFAPI